MTAPEHRTHHDDPRRHFAELLHRIDAADPSPDRDRAICRAVVVALDLGHTAGITIDLDRPDTPIAVIDLGPGTGRQITFALHPYRGGLDRIPAAEQTARIAAYARTAGGR